jgi:hypothetical protein
MGEAKRRRESGDTSAEATVRFVVNGKPSFLWVGTAFQAGRLQKEFLDTVKANGIEPDRYARISAGYHMAFGPPYPGDPDRRSNAKLGEVWGEAEATIARYAVLWLAFREEVEGTGQKFGDIFDGGDWIVAFDGTPAIIGSPFTMRIWQTSLVFPELVGQNPN